MTNMKKAIFISILLVLLYSCASDRETTIINQEANIDSYINTNFADSLIIRNNGSNRIVLSRNAGADSLAYGDSLYLYYAGYVFTTRPSALFATNFEELGESFKITDPDYSPLKVLFTENSFVPGLAYGLLGARSGEHSIVVFSAKYGFNSVKVYNIPTLSALLYEVVVEKVVKNN